MQIKANNHCKAQRHVLFWIAAAGNDTSCFLIAHIPKTISKAQRHVFFWIAAADDDTHCFFLANTQKQFPKLKGNVSFDLLLLTMSFHLF